MNLNEYFTTDLPVATVLRYFDHKLNSVDKTERRARFCFVRRDDTDDILKEYRERVLQVEPYVFFQCLKEMKDRLYNG